jgi:hypothetical protein
LIRKTSAPYAVSERAQAAGVASEQFGSPGWRHASAEDHASEPLLFPQVARPLRSSAKQARGSHFVMHWDFSAARMMGFGHIFTPVFDYFSSRVNWIDRDSGSEAYEFA